VQEVVLRDEQSPKAYRTELSPSRVNLCCNTNHSMINLCLSFCSGLTTALVLTQFPLDHTVFLRSDCFNHNSICTEVYLIVKSIAEKKLQMRRKLH